MLRRTAGPENLQTFVPLSVFYPNGQIWPASQPIHGRSPPSDSALSGAFARGPYPCVGAGEGSGGNVGRFLSQPFELDELHAFGSARRMRVLLLFVREKRPHGAQVATRFQMPSDTENSPEPVRPRKQGVLGSHKHLDQLDLSSPSGFTVRRAGLL